MATFTHWQDFIFIFLFANKSAVIVTSILALRLPPIVSK